MNKRLYAFAGGDTGNWRVTKSSAIIGEPLATVSRLDVVSEAETGSRAANAGGWVLRGITSNERYVVREEKDQLLARQQELGRAEATCAALIPLRKNAAWWALTQDERRSIFEEQSHHTAIGLRYQMAEVTARHLTGETEARFPGADMSTKLKLLGVDVASIGDAHGVAPDALNYVFTDEASGIYKKLVVSGDRKRLLGAVLVGEADDYGSLLQLTLNAIPLQEHPEDLILPAREGGAAKGMGVDALPDSALICSCNNVSKGALCCAVVDGATSLGALKKTTKAATTCGGCGPLVKQILDAQLKKQGVDVKNYLCEHFDYSRQELFHLTRIGGLKTFDQIISKHGKGRGCDICKPATASILAACWNDFILKPKHAPLQDTNDYYLANMQKDGTYSIVPRVPGGEITPEKLIVMGEVAKKFGLYTKITGAQRIDLFGARVEQLPLIWKDLVDAGFESGHAYAGAGRRTRSRHATLRGYL